MKRVVVIVAILAVILATVLVLMHSEKKLEKTLDDYQEVMEEGIPDDLKLTIYYVDPSMLTRIPILTLEDLMGYSPKIIQVDAAQLAVHRELLASLNAAHLKPVDGKENTENSIIGFLRLVYVLERGNGDVLLEVMATNLVYDDTVLVNGFEVENNPIFYELIDPFLTDEDRSILKWQESD